MRSAILLYALLFARALTFAATITVGPTGQYATPCTAIAVANTGDIIEIDATGTYTGDVCTIYANSLTIRGVNGRPLINAAGKNAQGKGTWVVVGDDALIENVEMSGATDPCDNGAAIRQEGTNLTLRNSYIHGNQEGILAADNASSSILIEFSEFARNGVGDGYTHNMYMGHVQQFTLQFSYSHLANVGHLVKSRAANNYILYNRLTDETGTASYELDIPNGGLTYVIGNVIQQSPSTENPNIAAYLEEGVNSLNPSQSLYLVNNTFVNSLGSGNFVLIGSSDSTPAVLENNIFSGGGTVTNQTSAVKTTNFVGTPLFANATKYDYHLLAGSPGIDAGTTPGTASGYALTPAYEYVYDLCGQMRNTVGAIDIGAFEYNGAGPILGCAIGAGGAGGPGAPGPSLQSLSLNPSSIKGGNTSVRNTVALTTAAGAQGVTIALSSSNAAVIVPASVTVSAGQSLATFSIATRSMNVPTVVTISASYGGQTISAPLTILPPTPGIESIKLANKSIMSGATLAGNLVTLTAPAPGQGVKFSLRSGSPAIASVPTSITVPAGATSAEFSITAGTVSAATSVGLSISYSDRTSQAFISVQPAGVH